MLFRRLPILVFALCLAAWARADDPVSTPAAPSAPATTPAAPAPVYRKVEIAPTRTSIYVGYVSMKMPVFVRKGDAYQSHYDAKVVPYFFYNEAGTLNVTVTDAQLQQLARGETIQFTGRAVNQDGEERVVTGRAVPKDATSGNIKVRVHVSKQVELIFNTTYRFVGTE